MATAHVTFGAAMGGGAPVYAPKPKQAEALTVSSTAAATDIAAESGDYASVVAVDADMYVVVGAGDASATNGYLIPAGQTRDFGPCKMGDTVSAITT